MPYLIDGYNLAHAMNLLPAKVGRQRLERARRHLLDHIADSPTVRLVRVVFDASAAPRNAPARMEHKGIVVLFAQKGSADDLIEDLIASEARPQQLVVVSDDHRLQMAGQRRGCSVLGCIDFLEKLALLPSSPPPPPAPVEEEKPSGMTAEDLLLLQELTNLDDDSPNG